MGRRPMHKLAAGAAVIIILIGVAIAAVTATGHGASPVRQVARARRAAELRGSLGGPLGPHLRIRAPQLIARDYLGLSRAQLRSDRRSGRTLGQIANSLPGKSQAGLIEALVSARRRQLAAAVSAGTLTQAEERTRLAKLAKRMRALVEHKPAERVAG